MMNTPDALQNKSSDGRLPWENLPSAQKQQVAELVAGAIKCGDFKTSDFEPLCNTLATAMLRDNTLDPAKLLSIMLPSQHDVRERVEDRAVAAADDLLLPYTWQVKVAREKLEQMPEGARSIIEAAIDSAHKENGPTHWRHRSPIGEARRREAILVKTMNDEGAVARILAQAEEGRASTPER